MLNSATVLFLSAALFLSFIISQSVVYADGHGKIRIYKLNKKKQLVRLRRIKNTSDEGCKNQRTNRKAHRFAQVGFKFCKVYAKANCQAGDEVTALWGGRNYRSADIDITQPQEILLEGAEWFFSAQENIIIRSWNCRY